MPSAVYMYLFTVYLVLTTVGVSPAHCKVTGLPCYTDRCQPTEFCDRIEERCSPCSCDVCRLRDIPQACHHICWEKQNALGLNTAHSSERQGTGRQSDTINWNLIQFIITLLVLLITSTGTWYDWTMRNTLKSLGRGEHFSVDGRKRRPVHHINPPNYSSIYQPNDMGAHLTLSREESHDAEENIAQTPQLEFIPVVLSPSADEPTPTGSSQPADRDSSLLTECACPRSTDSVVPESRTGHPCETEFSPSNHESVEPGIPASSGSDRRSITQPIIIPSVCRPPDTADEETSLKIQYN